MPSVDAIVFDLDDTLYPEREFAFSGFRAVAIAFETVLGDSKRSETEMRRLFDSDHRPRVFNALLAERGLSAEPALIAAMVRTYRDHVPAINLFADADAAITRLGGSYRLGLLTDGPLITQRNKVEALGLANRLDAIVYTDELGPGLGKPHIRPFTMVADRLGVAHERCVYVADNPAKDFVAPNSLGWKTIRVLRQRGVYATTPAAAGGQPAVTIPTLDEIDRLLVP